jgi:sugar phosphate isomerase/epimerase
VLRDRADNATLSNGWKQRSVRCTLFILPIRDCRERPQSLSAGQHQEAILEMALDPDTLVLCRGTIAAASFRERVGAASAAGFGGISLFAADYRDAKREGHSDADLRGLLRDHGVEIAELDPLLRWIPGQPDAEKGPEDEARFYAIAEALGARSINVALGAPGEVPTDVIVEAFAGVCDRAREHGLLAHLEFLPWTCIGDLPTAAGIVESAGRENGGVMFDSWHHARSGSPDSCLGDVDCSAIIAIQLNDAPALAEPNVVIETLHRRRLPGEGDIALVDLVRRLRKGGCTAPIGIEVFNDDLAALPFQEVAVRCAEATRPILKRAKET